MSDFDPYHTWLGIPPRDQPPHHYRLLGIELLEENPDVIAIAADRQMGFLRTFQSGRNSTESQRLLGEVAAARSVLLNAEQKIAYDDQLVGELDDDSIDDLPEVEIIDEDDSQTDADGIAPLPPPGTSPETPPDGDLRTVGNYQMLRALDKSQTGAVFKARHLTMKRIVAVKILSQQAAESEMLMRRFQRKVKILARLSHPNLIAVHNAGQFKGRPYMEMEFVDGRNLAELLSATGPLPVEYAINYAMQAAAGLGFAHEAGVYHRNVKPSNLLIDQQTGEVKVIGLGLARMSGPLADENSFQEALTTPGTTMGTFDYMAPEQCADASTVDRRADIYSLGCTLYAMLTGSAPYQSIKSPMKKLLAHRDGEIPSLAASRSDAPASIDAAYQKMLAKNPDDRLLSMAEVIAALGLV
jgi:tRNA A-37 threonylcarbamoyl transferase component Bud32